MEELLIEIKKIIKIRKVQELDLSSRKIKEIIEFVKDKKEV